MEVVLLDQNPISSDLSFHVENRCEVGDEDACLLDSVWKLISNHTLVFTLEDRTIAVLPSEHADLVNAVLPKLRGLGFDVDVASASNAGMNAMLEKMERVKLPYSKNVVMLRVGNRVLPFLTPGFISLRKDGSVGGTVFAPYWLVPSACYEYGEDEQYVRIRGVGTFGVDVMSLLTPAPRVGVDRECRLRLPDFVTIRVVDAYHTNMSIVYNGIVIIKRREVEDLVWAGELIKAVDKYKAGERKYRIGHYVNTATLYRVGIAEFVDIARKVARESPRSSAEDIAGVAEALDWLRGSAKDMLALMAPKSSSSGVVGMEIGSVSLATKDYIRMLRGVVKSSTPPNPPEAPRIDLGDGFYLQESEAYWIERALKKLVGMRIRAPYVTIRGAFMHEATIERVVVRDIGIDVLMSDGLRYRLRTHNPTIIDLVNFAMLLGDDKVREVFTKALDEAREESRRTAGFIQSVLNILKDLSIE